MQLKIPLISKFNEERPSWLIIFLILMRNYMLLKTKCLRITFYSTCKLHQQSFLPAFSNSALKTMSTHVNLRFNVGNQVKCFLYSTILQFFYSRDKKKMKSDCLVQILNSQYSPHSQLLKKSTFDISLNEESFDNSSCMMFEDYIIIKVKSNMDYVSFKITFGFELLFYVVRAESSQITNNNGDLIAIRLQKQNKSILLKAQGNSKDLLAWRDIFKKKLNQRGFHQLFKPIKKIGKGNFASVYLVIKHEDNKKYAVKAFSKEAIYGQDRGRQSLIKQIQLMRRLSHKNLMKIYGVYETENSIYISVELLEGGQLYDKINLKQKFTNLQIKMVMKGLLEGLDVMHKNNLMHRDLKPQNILLRKENDFDCVIADFGLAQSTLSEQYLFVRCGTPGFVAPQIANLKDNKAKYSSQCDLFSLGVIFHMLVLKASPFPGKQYDEVFHQNRVCKINFQSTQYKLLPILVLDLLVKLLEKDPVKRITASEALKHDFFSNDSIYSEVSRAKSSIRQEIIAGKDEQQDRRKTGECQSPLMLNKNHSRKAPAFLREDSCLKFKMKENVLTGRIDQTDSSVSQINSPELKSKSSKIGVIGPLSRFKKASNT